MTFNRQARFPQWAWAILGAVTILALAILVLSVVLGVRAGQQQYELQSRQQVAIALQSAIDLRAEGRFAEALEEYRHVLTLDPENAAANEGILSLLSAAQGTPTAAPVAAAPLAPAAGGEASTQGLLTPAVVLSTAQKPASAGLTTTLATGAPAPTVTSAAGSLTDQAQVAFRAGRWQVAVDLLSQIYTTPEGAQNVQVASQLFESLVNLATEKDNENNLEGALTYYDRALELRPTEATVRAERDLINSYLDMLTSYGADWASAVATLTELFGRDPQYRDVSRRLQAASQAYADQLAQAGDWCAAADQFDTVTALAPTTELLLLRDRARLACESGATPVALATPGVGTPAATPPAAAPAALAPPGNGPVLGSILYSARDVVDGRNLIFAQPANGSAATVVVENGAQPALRPDGVRLAYRNLRSDMGGVSATDPATGVFFRITDYTEDVLPTWGADPGRVVFASNREGDRRWRIYAAWAEEFGEVVTLSFGESPAWSPVQDLVLHRGCDESGNGCGLWLMDGSGRNRSALTTVAADNRPAWSPDGRYAVFMSDGRDANMEIYRVDSSTGQVVRLTGSPALDVLPAVSPDGQWVAFISNRDGAWKLYAVPLAGGEAQLVAALKGELGDWSSQGVQWVP